MTQREANTRSERGAKFLDERDKGWHSSVDLTLLEMSDCFHCVLGQRSGDYEDGLNRYKLEGNEIQFGFTAEINPAHSIESYFRSTDWNRLTTGWKKAINRRRKK
jgi:hypothetical protein